MNNYINYIKNANKYFAISIIIIVIGIVFLFINGLNLDIDFTGGTAIEANLKQDFSEQDIRNLVKEVTDSNALIQKTGEDSKGVMISFTQIEEEKIVQIETKLKEAYPDAETPNTRVVQATYGAEMVKNTLIAVVVAIVFMIIYIAIRFSKLGGLSSGVTAIIGLIHNALIVTSTYVIFNIPINSAFIAAILTVIGYSINNTIVIYDRIRENREDKELCRKKSLEEVVNITISQVFKRTINTTITSVTTVAILLAFAIYFSQQTLIEFTLPLIVGLISGAYASICISTTLWYKWQAKSKK